MATRGPHCLLYLSLNRNYSVAIGRLRTLLLGQERQIYSAEQKNDEYVRHKPVRRTNRTPVSVVEIKMHLQQSVESLAPGHNGDWQSLPLMDIALKTRLLLSCERELDKRIPNTSLGSLQTVGDVLTCLSTTRPPPPALFSQLSRLDSRPANLSLQYPYHKKPHDRKPFQNYDDPRHRSFPDKKAKQKKWNAIRKRKYNVG